MQTFKTILALVFTWAFFFSEPSLAKSPAFSADKSKKVTSQPYLWKIESKDKQPSWLFGTIHIAVDIKTQVRKDVWTAFESSVELLVEADTSKLTPAVVAKYLTLPEKDKLSNYVKPKSIATLGKAMGMLPAQMESLQPWYVSTGYLLSMDDKKVASMDSVFEAHAKKSKKSVIPLEEAESQLAIMASLDKKAMGKELNEFAKFPSKVKLNLKNMVNYYVRGDADKLSTLIQKDTKKIPGMYEKLLVARNKKWIPAIVKSVSKGNAFIAVGAGHLLGKDSVVELLQKKGYKVTRVK